MTTPISRFSLQGAGGVGAGGVVSGRGSGVGPSQIKQRTK